MKEATLRVLFEKHLANNNTKFTSDLKTNAGLVDYVIESDGQLHAIEVRGSRANTSNTIGHLVNIHRAFSHVYLLAPPTLIEKVDKILKGARVLPTLGIITVGKEGPVYIKKPSPDRYYFNKPEEVKTKSIYKAHHLILNATDKEILQHFKEIPLTVAEVSKTLGTTMPNAYRRILRLKRAKLIEELTDGSVYPKTYKIVPNLKIDEIISLDV
ncbi:MAG: winged helix-turn-helix transcriptional regulator [Candidatus Aenigmarchaeota archaeon]|nr:winged helix-turn-helix transcriptional regulator [Candidatus Aenigmarchaeota archaeon]